MTGIVQAVDESAGRPGRVSATTDLHEIFFHSHRHPLIEDETFSLPMFVSELLLVSRDPAVKLKDFLESLAPQQR